jgi:hypothetical protein
VKTSFVLQNFMKLGNIFEFTLLENFQNIFPLPLKSPFLQWIYAARCRVGSCVNKLTTTNTHQSKFS